MEEGSRVGVYLVTYELIHSTMSIKYDIVLLKHGHNEVKSLVSMLHVRQDPPYIYME